MRLNFEVDQNQRNEFIQLLEQSGNVKRGVLMSALVTKIDDSYIFVDVGLKSDGKIAKEEFNIDENDHMPKLGDTITVLLEALEDKNGEIALSYTKAVREAGWGKLEEFFHKRTHVSGTVVRKISGGFVVNIQGISTFLPKSHLPTTIKEVKDLFAKPYQFLITKMDKSKSSIVVAIKISNQEMELPAHFAEGQIVNATVKNVNEVMAFCDVEGHLARMHISEMSWNKIKDPSEVLKIDEKIQVQILSISETNRIYLSLKNLIENPWFANVKKLNINVGDILDGVVRYVEEKNVHIQLKNAVEAKLPPSNVSWIKRNQNFSEIHKGDAFQVKVMEIDDKRSKITISLKHLSINPVKAFAKTHKVGDQIEGKVIDATELGYIVQLAENLDGIMPKIEGSAAIALNETLNLFICKIEEENGNIILGKEMTTKTAITSAEEATEK